MSEIRDGNVADGDPGKDRLLSRVVSGVDSIVDWVSKTHEKLRPLCWTVTIMLVVTRGGEAAELLLKVRAAVRG
ncbi:hypothetical protein JQS43_03440 [Natronosporangium hydrolyticum]|uniref:Uncharacterized protein n=1 Tax=Natronosporangium hydrolyticum TaxID=2811111 RepID=A0A895YL79_9ACTN|nr:hypothetical protein [Natronosporangium hydrolyticum]QSB15426.1 hypothetical protein JQS43_03440 [Natronosporangium hydrolyticum]